MPFTLFFLGLIHRNFTDEDGTVHVIQMWLRLVKQDLTNEKARTVFSTNCWKNNINDTGISELISKSIVTHLKLMIDTKHFGAISTIGERK